MRKSTRAALLSGLVFPGIGQLYLKRRWRGVVLAGLALLALGTVVTVAVERALAIVDRILSGEIPVDAATISALVTASDDADSLTVSVAGSLLVACWLLGILDALRPDSAQHGAENSANAD